MNHSPLPTRENLLDLLDREIGYAQSQEQRAGWTLWAISGALAAIFLLLLTTWEAGQFSFRTTAKWILVVALPVDLAINLLWGWSASATDARPGYRYFHEFEHQQIGYGWRELHFILVLWIAISISHDIWTPATVFVIVWYGLLALIGLALIPLSSAELPFLQKPLVSKRGTLIFLFVLFILIGCSVCAYLRSISPLRPGARATELKIAVLLVASSCLVFRLLLGIRQPWQLRRLVATRRELALGEIELEAAIRTARVLLIGGGAQLALEAHLRKTKTLLLEARECAERTRSLIIEYQPWWEALQQKWSGLSPKQRRNALEGSDDSLDTIEEATKVLRKWIARVQKRESDLNRYYAQMQRESPASFAEGQEAVGVLHQQVQHQSGWISGVGDWADEQSKLLREGSKRLRTGR